jgi:hypothetical protein
MLMAQPLSVSRQTTLGKGPPGQTRGVIDDLALLIGAPLLRGCAALLAASLPDTV